MLQFHALLGDWQATGRMQKGPEFSSFESEAVVNELQRVHVKIRANGRPKKYNGEVPVRQIHQC